MKIGFIYYTFSPVSGGASVHGYNLARELHELGYELYKLNGRPDPFTRKLENPIRGLFRILKNCDLIYIRMDYFLNLRNLISLLALAGRKKIIVEINSPSDELHLFGRGKSYIRWVDRIMSKILKRMDAVITVSEPLRQYCVQALALENVHVIENGGEIFDDADERASRSIKDALAGIRKKFSKIVVWSGSVNDMQDLSHFKKIAATLKRNTAIVLVVKEEMNREFLPVTEENVFLFKNLSRNDVKYIVSNSDIGMAFYSEYPWSRWGFYNSSLKIFEYLNNGLLTITNTTGIGIQQTYPNFRFAEDIDEIIRLIEEYSDRNFKIKKPRTWSDVANETSRIIQDIVNR